MAYIHARQRWKRQPSGLQEINQGHWAASAHILSFVPWRFAPYEPGTRSQWTVTGTPTTGFGEGGCIANGVDAAGSYWQLPDSVKNSPTKIIIVARVKLNAGVTGRVLVNKNYNGANVPYHLDLTAAAVSPAGMSFFDGVAWRTCQFVTDIAGDGKWHDVGGSYDGANNVVYLDRKADNTVAFAGSLPDNANAVTIGSYINDGKGFGGSIEYVHIFDGSKLAPSVSVVKALQEAPYAIFRPQQRRIYVDVAAAGAAPSSAGVLMPGNLSGQMFGLSGNFQ